MSEKKTVRREKRSKISHSSKRIKKVTLVALSDTKKSNALEKSLPLLSPLEELADRFEKVLKSPRISIVIVNRNGVEFLRNCLFALKTQTYPIDEMILVDNGSSDNSVAYVHSEYSFVKILESAEDWGLVPGVNLGTKCATGDLVVVLGNNMVPTPDWLGHLVAEFQSQWPQAAIVSSKQLSNRKSNPHSSFNQEVNFLGNRIECEALSRKFCFAPEGLAFIYARHLNLEGPFDQDYQMGQEDIYFGWRTRLSGKRVAVNAGAKVFQKENSLLLPRWKEVYLENRNRWMNLLVFYDRANLLRILPWVFLEILIKILAHMATSLSGFVGSLAAIFWILFHPARIYSKRKSIQKKRKVSDAEITRFMSGKIMSEGSRMAGLLNGLSLAYCDWVSLEVMENRANKV